MQQDNFSTEKAFNVYIDYLALKRHFTTDSYDYHKYNGKVRANFDSFRTRNDVFYFHKLSKKDDNHDLLLSNIVKKPDIWIRDLCDEPAETNLLQWKKIQEALSYYLKSDLNNFKPKYQTNFEISDGQIPYIMTLYLQKQISLETFAIISNLSNVFPYWETEMSNNFIAKDLIKLSKKYYPFLDFDAKKVKELIKETFF